MLISVKNFGAMGDGITNDTKAIQQAINETSANGETLYFPKGVYRTGTLFLQDDTHLDLSSKATIMSTAKLEDYSDDIIGAIEAPSFSKVLFYAKDKKNIAITGAGVIDGMGAEFPEGPGRASRPMMFRIIDCTNIIFRDVTFKDSASWCCHMMFCVDVCISNVKIYSQVRHNNDGFDLDNCKNVRISDCDLRTGDDAICLKSTTDAMCENITVTNCHIVSDTAAVKFGTSSRGGFKNISITTCSVSETMWGVIKLLIVDGGVLENINISDIVMNDVGSPLFIRVGARNLKFEKPAEMNHKETTHDKSDKKSVARRINISNILAYVTQTQLDRTPIMLAGDTQSYIEDVNLENFRVIFPGGGQEEHRNAVVEEDRFIYPEQCYFGILPAWGFYARYVDGLRISNMHLSLQGEDKREKMIFDNVLNLDIKD